MTQVDVTLEHPGAHEPDGETFREDFSKALTKALTEQGLKRGDGEPAILGYTQISGVKTVYTVELDTEARETKRAARKAAAKPAPDADAAPAEDPAAVDQDEPNTGE